MGYMVSKVSYPCWRCSMEYLRALAIACFRQLLVLLGRMSPSGWCKHPRCYYGGSYAAQRLSGGCPGANGAAGKDGGRVGLTRHSYGVKSELPLLALQYGILTSVGECLLLAALGSAGTDEPIRVV